ncbi:MAG: twin-arginine translocation signal domain-containing protein [SAR202 cluster bacterium]|nr:twin-arginine translocation signal domain-containing protein [SAR202 cluster bacterium]
MAQRGAAVRNNDRRGFLKRVALVGAAAAALGTLARRPFGGTSRSGPRNVPADLPGPGSIFQPRNDPRIFK